MIIQGQSQHRIDDQHQRRSSKVMSQPHDLPTMRDIRDTGSNAYRLRGELYDELNEEQDCFDPFNLTIHI
nr:expressed protein [Hymenolepis microstoma]